MKISSNKFKDFLISKIKSSYTQDKEPEKRSIKRTLGNATA